MITNRIATVAIAAGITSAKQLAEVTKLAYNTAHGLWTGRASRIDLVTIERICRALNAQPGQLFTMADVQPHHEMKTSVQRYGKTRLMGRFMENVTDQFALDPTGMPFPALGFNVYEGHRGVAGCTVLVNDVPLHTLVDEDEYRFNWGYEGGGPTVLARAMMRYEYGEVAAAYANPFREDVLLILPRELGGLEWVLDSHELQLWLKLRTMMDNNPHF